MSFMSGTMQQPHTGAAPPGAVNEEFSVAGAPGAAAASAGAPRALRHAPSAGWDPFEIWRTRVRDARREPPSPPAG